MSGYSEEIILKAWENGIVVFNNDPDAWRKDDCGSWIYRRFYGDRSSRFGWEIARNSSDGPDAVCNPRPLQWQNLVAKGLRRLECSTATAAREWNPGTASRRITCSW